ncbi:MAG: hypothetical protein M3Z75_21530 [Actinomycetota bacterium]|nr:hypothetical protein [Actinomycetota bacterium]
MTRTHVPWILIGIEAVAWVMGNILGLVLATLGLVVIYLVSVRVHPRIRHRGCGGTGEHRGAVFTWTHRKCPRCTGGRLVRWGAGQWGSEHIRNEYSRTKEARAAARSNGTWR